MELCTTRALANPSPLNPHLSSINGCRFHFKPSFPLKKRAHFSGVLSRTSLLLRATSEERNDDVATLEDGPSVDTDVTLDSVSPVNQSSYKYNGTRQSEPSEEVESPSDEPIQPFNELLEKLNIQFDSEDSYTLLLYGGGALVAVWFLSAIVAAVDSIPVLPKLMEVVGLGYTLWFTSRYLLFKRNRKELFSKIEELKQEILGSSDN